MSAAKEHQTSVYFAIRLLLNDKFCEFPYMENTILQLPVKYM